MAESNLFDDIQESVDAITHVVQQCAAEECSVGDMWAEIDAHCHRLAQLSAGDIPDDEDDDETDDVVELNFDGAEDGHRDDDEDEEVLH